MDTMLTLTKQRIECSEQFKMNEQMNENLFVFTIYVRIRSIVKLVLGAKMNQNNSEIFDKWEFAF